MNPDQLDFGELFYKEGDSEGDIVPLETQLKWIKEYERY